METDGRSFACNGRLVRKLREMKGLTQSGLARLSGYSVRLIGKAEAGKPISASTIEVLAEALSSKDRILSPNDLVIDLLSITRNYLKVLSQLDHLAIQNFQAYLSKNLVVRVLSDQTQFPFQNRYTGIDGLTQYYRHLFTICDGNSLEDPSQTSYEVFESGPNVVVWKGPFSNFKLRQESDSSISITSWLRFAGGKIVAQEDRFVMSKFPVEAHCHD